MGSEYVVAWDEIEPEAIYIKVELTPDVPTDRIQKINAAVLGVEKLGMSKERSMEEIGINDPQAELKQHYMELLTDAHMQNYILAQQLEVQSQNEIQTQAELMQMQAQLQQAQQAQQFQMEQAQMGMGMKEAQGMMGPQGVPGAGGQGMNPNMGGMPPQMMAPEATREGQTGRTRSGNNVAEVG
jgi:hypothetical protein